MYEMRTTILLASALLLSFSSSYAADEGSNEWVASIGNTGLLIRKPISEHGAIFVGINLTFGDSSYDSGDWIKYRDIFVEAGYRRYLGDNNLKFFIDGSVAYAHPSESSSTNISSSSPVFTGFMLAYGVEKYLSNSFSVEGSAGIRIGHTENDTSKHTSISLPAARLAVNYHF